MLQSIRDRTHGWVAGVIISLLILSFGMWGIHSYLESVGRSDVIAKVNNIEITKRQLAAAYEPLRNQVQASADVGVLPAKVEAGLKHKALENLINIQVLRQSAVANNFLVADLQVETYLERMQEFQVDGKFSLPRFQQLIASNRISVGDFLQLIHTTLLIDQPKAGIVLSAFTLPNEVKAVAALIKQQRDVSYLSVPTDAFLQTETISDADVADYYATHKHLFKTPETVEINYLSLALNDVLATLPQPTAEEATNYYNDNANSYTAPQQWKLAIILIPVAEQTTVNNIDAAEKKITQIQADLKNGASFEKLALQYPADEKANTPDWITLALVPSELQKTVSSLTQNGQVSDVIKVSKGLALVKAVDIKPAQVTPFEQVKAKVIEAIQHQKAQEKFAELKEKLANLTYEHPDTLEPAASALALKMQTTAAFTQDKGNDGITTNKKIRDVAFSQDVLTSQNNSDVIPVSADTVVVLRVKSHIPATFQSPDAVHNNIVAQLKADKAEQKAAAVALAAKQKLESGVAPDAVAAEYHGTWVTLGYLDRNATKVDAAILATAFHTAPPKSPTQPSYAIAKLGSGDAIVAVNAIRAGVIDPKNQQEYNVLADQVQNSAGMLEYKLYEKSLEKSAKVKITGDLD